MVEKELEDYEAKGVGVIVRYDDGRGVSENGWKGFPKEAEVIVDYRPISEPNPSHSKGIGTALVPKKK